MFLHLSLNENTRVFSTLAIKIYSENALLASCGVRIQHWSADHAWLHEPYFRMFLVPQYLVEITCPAKVFGQQISNWILLLLERSQFNNKQAEKVWYCCMLK